MAALIQVALKVNIELDNTQVKTCVVSCDIFYLWKSKFETNFVISLVPIVKSIQTALYCKMHGSFLIKQPS